MKVWAHRGASMVAPENTMAAFAKAHELGADAIELDVHRTADGVPVVIHDETVARTTNGRGYIHSGSFAWVRSLDAGSRFHPNFRGEQIPSLEEVLAFVRSTSMSLNVEIKNNQVLYSGIETEVVQLLDQYKMIDRTVLSSFNHDSVKKVRALREDLSVAFLCTEFQPVNALYAKQFGVQALHPSIRVLNPNYMREALHLNIAIRPYTVDDEQTMRILQSWGVDAVITNDVALGRQTVPLDEMGQ